MYVRRSLFMSVMLGCALPAIAQSPDLDALMRKAADQAATLDRSLPSFTCKRAGTSELIKASSGKVEKHVPFTGEVRALRRGDALDEKITYTSVNGKPSRKQGDAPYDVLQSFTGALRYVAADEQGCYRFTLGAPQDGHIRVDFTATRPFQPRCENVPGTAGYALFDDEGNITHIERTIPEALAAEADLVPFGAVDLAPVVLDGKTYRLVSRLQSERQDGKDLRRLDVAYTDCKLFHANVTLLPGEDIVPDDGKKP